MITVLTVLLVISRSVATTEFHEELASILRAIDIKHFEDDPVLFPRWEEQKNLTSFSTITSSDTNSSKLPAPVLYSFLKVTGQDVVIIPARTGGAHEKIQNHRTFVGLRLKNPSQLSYYATYIYLRPVFHDERCITCLNVDGRLHAVEFDTWDNRFRGFQDVRWFHSYTECSPSVFLPCRDDTIDRMDQKQRQTLVEVVEAEQRRLKSINVTMSYESPSLNNNGLRLPDPENILDYFPDFDVDVHHLKLKSKREIADALSQETTKSTDGTPMGNRSTIIPKPLGNRALLNLGGLLGNIIKPVDTILSGITGTKEKNPPERRLRPLKPKHKNFAAPSQVQSYPSAMNQTFTEMLYRELVEQEAPELKNEKLLEQMALQPLYVFEDDHSSNSMSENISAILQHVEKSLPRVQGLLECISDCGSTAKSLMGGVKRERRSIGLNTIGLEKDNEDVTNKDDTTCVAGELPISKTDAKRAESNAKRGSYFAHHGYCTLSFSSTKFWKQLHVTPGWTTRGPVERMEQIQLEQNGTWFHGLGACKTRPRGELQKLYMKANTTESLLKIYLEILRIQCIRKERHIYEAMIENDCLMILPDKTFQLHSTCYLMLRSKLSDRDFSMLSKTFQLAVLTPLLKSQLEGTLHLAELSSDGAIVSGKVESLVQYALRSVIRLYQNAARLHFIRLYRGIVELTDVFSEALLTDREMTASCIDCHFFRYVNLNDLRYLKGLSIYLLQVISWNSKENFHKIYHDFILFYRGNHSYINKRL